MYGGSETAARISEFCCLFQSGAWLGFGVGPHQQKPLILGQAPISNPIIITSLQRTKRFP